MISNIYERTGKTEQAWEVLHSAPLGEEFVGGVASLAPRLLMQEKKYGEAIDVIKNYLDWAKTNVANPEAVRFMLEYFYAVDATSLQEYNPRTQEINKDILRLSEQYNLPGLKERAVRWVAKDLTTGNVVERLTICELMPTTWPLRLNSGPPLLPGLMATSV